MNDPRRQKIFLYFIFFFALALRVAYSFYLQNNYFFHNSPGEDVVYYKNWAKAIVFGDMPNTTPFAGMPLFPYFLAVLFKLTQGHWAAVGFFNLVLGSFNCVLVYLLAQKLFSNRTAVIASILAATNFILIYYDWLMMPITLLITLTLLILIALSGREAPLGRQAPHGRREGLTTQKDWFILGLVIGLASLGDAKFLIFATLLIAYVIWRKGSKFVVPLLLGLILIVGGVTVRNKIVGGDWVFISSQSGLSLFVGNNPEANGAYEHPEFMRPSHEGQDTDQRIFVEKALGKKVTADEVSDFYRKKAYAFIFGQPVEYLKLLGKKLVLFVSDTEHTQAIDLILQRPYKLQFDYNSYLLIFPLAILGILLSWRAKNKELPYSVLILTSQLVFCLIYFVSTRHRASILPILIIFEAFALTWLIEKIYSRQYRALVATTVMLAAFMFMFPPKFLDERTFAFMNLSKAGSVYDGKKEFTKAAQAYTGALSLQPTDANSLYNLATAYVNLKEYEKAKILFLKALEINAFNVDVLFNLGYVYEETGETQKALNSYEHVLAYAPESIDAHYRIANLYQIEGNCALAKPHFDAIVSQNPILRSEIEKIFNTCQNKK